VLLGAQEKGQRVVIGAGLLGGAALVALYGLGALVAAVIMLIGSQLEPWLAALIVALVLLTTAAILALVGKKQAQRMVPPIPEQAVESVQEDVQHIKERMGR
jgi:multisubunit Na+/H+ antiporter MnhC subunit